MTRSTQNLSWSDGERSSVTWCCWIERFGVDPEARGKGIGRKLFGALAEHFKAAGAHTLRTFVDTRQKETATFLEAVGFGPSALTALEQKL